MTEARNRANWHKVPDRDGSSARKTGREPEYSFVVRTVPLGAACTVAVVGRNARTDVGWIHDTMVRSGVRVDLWALRRDGTEWPVSARRIETVRGPLELIAARPTDGGGAIVASPDLLLSGPDGFFPLGAAVPGMPVQLRGGAISAIEDVSTIRVPVAFVLALRETVLGWVGNVCAVLGGNP